jgi:hypothetical protein
MTEKEIVELRTMPAEERVRRLQAWKEQRSTRDAEISTTTTHWHEVDHDLTPEQIADLPAAQAGDTRTPLLWVKFRHPRLKKVVVAKGRFDYAGGRWTARLSSVDDGDIVSNIVALEWAPIVTEERPWEGPTIRMHEADPW